MKLKCKNCELEIREDAIYGYLHKAQDALTCNYARTLPARMLIALRTAPQDFNIIILQSLRHQMTKKAVLAQLSY